MVLGCQPQWRLRCISISWQVSETLGENEGASYSWGRKGNGKTFKFVFRSGGVAYRLSLLKSPVQRSHAHTGGVYKARASRSHSQGDTGAIGVLMLWKKPFPLLPSLCRICFSLSITSVCLLAAKRSRVWRECGQRRPASGKSIFRGYWSCLISRTYNERGIEIRCQRPCQLM